MAAGPPTQESGPRNLEPYGPKRTETPGPAWLALIQPVAVSQNEEGARRFGSVAPLVVWAERNRLQGSARLVGRALDKSPDTTNKFHLEIPGRSDL